MRFSALLLILLGICSNAQPSWAQIEFGDGSKFPSEADNSQLLPESSPLQIGGSCHTYAAATMIEAGCHAITGKLIPLSRGYLLERFLVQQLHRYKEDCVAPDKVQPGALLSNGHDGTASSWPEIQQMCDGSLCTEAEFPTTREPFDGVISTIAEGGSDLKATYKKTLAILETDLKENGANASANGAPSRSTTDADLLDCLKKSKPNQFRFNLKLVVALISKGYPVLCEGNVNTTGIKGGHALVILGYRYNEKATGKVEYKVIEPNSTTATWGWDIPTCFQIYWLGLK